MPHSNQKGPSASIDDNGVKSGRVDAIAHLESGKLNLALEWAKHVLQNKDDVLDLVAAAKVFSASGDDVCAENALNMAIEIAPVVHRPYTDLALLHLRRKNPAQAIRCLSDRLSSVPDDQECQFLLAVAHHFKHDALAEIDSLERLLSIRPDFEAAWEQLRHAYVVVANTNKVIESNHRWLETCPNSFSAKYLLKSVEGDDIPDTACLEYLSESFDRSARYYDAIQGALDYKGPESLGLMLEKLYPEAVRQGVVLDAGCGTGLAATRLRTYARQLVGVDLSEKMLDVARCRGCYDRLLRCDLFEHLKSNVETYDLIAAMDSFSYFGDLEKLIPTTLAALRPGGHAIFSLDPGQMAPDTWFIQPNGRFSQSPPYIIRVMGENGIPDGTMRRVKWRNENGKDYFALLIAIQRPGSSEEKNPAG